MTREQAELSLWNGFSLASELSSTADIMGIGELGIGNTTPATIIACASCHLSPKLVTGRGTGLSDEALKHKIDIIEKVIQNRSPNPVDGLDLLMNVGGYEIGGMAGFILGCAKHKKPVIIDGLICTAAAVIAHLICPTASQYVIAAHLSQEPAQAAMLKLLDKRPLLDLSLRLGEGTGAALAMPLVDCAQGLLCDMMTLEDAMAL
jgi:nicotinate-nucleotide--dimethylbenzimidazole phosphoribosyltransferase